MKTIPLFILICLTWLGSSAIAADETPIPATSCDEVQKSCQQSSTSLEEYENCVAEKGC